MAECAMHGDWKLLDVLGFFKNILLNWKFQADSKNRLIHLSSFWPMYEFLNILSFWENCLQFKNTIRKRQWFVFLAYFTSSTFFI